MPAQLQIVVLTKSKLKEALEENLFWKEGVAPMSKTRAEWIVQSPRIHSEDYCGVLGMEGDTIISFVYMLPELLNNSSGKNMKVYFMHMWWVANKYKGSPVATYIYNEALKLTERQIIIKSYANGAEAFYDKLPFKVITERLRYTLFFSMDTSMLLGRFSFLKKVRFIINFLDKMTYKFLKLRNYPKIKKRIKGLTYDYVKEIDDYTWNFIAPLCNIDLIQKDKAYFNWHINEAQYLQAPANNLPYSSLLSGVSNNVDIYNFSIIKEQQIIGFVSCIKNYNECNVRYFLVKEEENYQACVAALMNHFLKIGTTFIFTDDSELATTIKKQYHLFFTYAKNKKGLAHNAVDFDFNNYQFNSQDAHYY